MVKVSSCTVVSCNKVILVTECVT